MNISRLDHIVILCADTDRAASSYETLLGRPRDWQHANAEDGTASVIFRLNNTSVELLSPYGDGEVGERIKELLNGGEGLLSSLAFSVEDIRSAHYTANRRGLSPGPIDHMQASYGGQTRSWARFRCDDRALSGLRVFMYEETAEPVSLREGAADAAFRLDHLVVNTANPDRAMAAYGAKLGLRLALDRTNEDWGARFLFFRLPDLTFEVVQRLQSDMTSDDADTLWGLTWAVKDLDAAHERLTKAGVAVSEVRKGRKPGTRVMSIKSHDLGIPTLFLDAKSVQDQD